jgi:putative transferase (TIGR04331 family)
MSDIWTAERLFLETHRIDSDWTSQIDWLSQVIARLSREQCSAREAGLLAGFWLLHLVHQVRTVVVDETPVRAIPKDDSTFYVAESRRKQLLADLRDIAERRRVDELIRAVWSARALPENLALLPLVDDSNLSRTNKKSKLRSLARHPKLLVGKKVLFVDPYLRIGRTTYLKAILSTWRWATWQSAADDDLHVEPNLDANARLEMARSVTISTVSDLTKALVPLLIPHGYCENRKSVRRQVLSQVSEQPKVLYTATGLQMSLGVQHMAASWGSKGTLVTTHQHGGHTGLDYQHVLEDLEVSLSDIYYTFGWTDSRQNVRPLAIPLPTGRVGKPKSTVLLMSLESAPFLYRLQPFCIPQHVTKCLEESRRFLSSLSAEVDVSIRAKQQEQLVLKSSNLSARLTDVVGSGPKAASKFGLVVHNYLGTSWLETLALDIPTVCFIPTGIHKFRAAAQPFADALIRVGVLHYSGSEAAKFVNSLRGNPTAWWQSVEVQEAREAFVARYANFSDNWLEAWTEEFERLLS